jgi:hypothetical protein
VADLYREEYNGLPDRDVRTVRDLIYYQYAKIIMRSALHAPDGAAAKGNYYGFIKQTFREPHKRLFTYLGTSLNLRDQTSICHQRPLPRPIQWNGYHETRSKNEDDKRRPG